MINFSLFNILVGYFAEDKQHSLDPDLSYLKNLPENEKIRKSVIDNLTMILQTRRGSILHLPDFGLPDIMQIYIDSGYKFDALKKYIQETILKYEPRISAIRVENPHFDKDNFRIHMKIIAQIKDLSGTDVLLTEFSTTGWAQVILEKEA